MIPKDALVYTRHISCDHKSRVLTYEFYKKWLLNAVLNQLLNEVTRNLPSTQTVFSWTPSIAKFCFFKKKLTRIIFHKSMKGCFWHDSQFFKRLSLC